MHHAAKYWVTKGQSWDGIVEMYFEQQPFFDYLAEFLATFFKILPLRPDAAKPRHVRVIRAVFKNFIFRPLKALFYKLANHMHAIIA